MILKKEQAMEMIEMYRLAEIALLSGKSYKIGSRELTRMDLSEIQKGRQYWEEQLAIALNNGRRRTAKRVVIRDL